jgi:hypothetical protein
MARLVLPGGPGGVAASSFIFKQRKAGAFWRSIGFCGIDRFGLVPPYYTGLAATEIVVGHENFFRDGVFCWEENDWAMRGAARFPLTLRDAAPGFHEREQAWLTWRKVEDGRTPAFHVCTQAITIVGQAQFDWLAGAYKNDATVERHNLQIGGASVAVSDADATVPRSVTPHLRRVEVTEIVRSWVEHLHPNFGFVFIGDERFVQAPNLVRGPTIPEIGTRWQSCVGVYTGFELVFADIGHMPSYGRSAEDL